jgi:hypothetical protein
LSQSQSESSILGSEPRLELVPEIDPEIDPEFGPELKPELEPEPSSSESQNSELNSLAQGSIPSRALVLSLSQSESKSSILSFGVGTGLEC